jgi:exosortase/archaeosortase family protein
VAIASRLRRALMGTDDRWRVLGFVLRLLAGCLLATSLLALQPGIEHWAVMNTVGSVRGALRLASIHPQIAGTTVVVEQAALRIVPECTPLMPTVLLAVAIAAYPARLRWKLLGIGAGLIILWLFNTVRMLALLGTLIWWPRGFTFVHVYLWQTITLLVVSGLFVAWLRLTRGRGEARGDKPR